MKAFIAGATGYTGRALVAILRQRGHDVVAHVRPDSTALERWRAEFAPLGAAVDSTPWRTDTMSAALDRERPTHIYALLGTTRRRMRAHGAAANSYEAVDYGLTALLLRAARTASPQARFIYLSALGASERAGEYLRVRGRIEAELRESGLSWVAARPAFVTGPDREDDRPAERLVARASDAALHLLAAVGVRAPARKYASLSAPALAAALAAIAEQELPDGVYEAAALRSLAAELSRR